MKGKKAIQNHNNGILDWMPILNRIDKLPLSIAKEDCSLIAIPATVGKFVPANWASDFEICSDKSVYQNS